MVVRSSLEEGLSLHYVTSKLIVLSSPDEGTEKAYSESLKNVTLALKTKHYEHFKVWNVSRSRHDLTRCLLAEDYGWPAGLAPPLDRLCALCKQFEQWLTSHTDNVAVIHCKGDRSRAAIVVSSYLHYNAICSEYVCSFIFCFFLLIFLLPILVTFSDDTVEDRVNIQRFVDKYIGANGQPSHKRYITYFSSLLSGKIRVNSSPVYLKRITISQLVGRLVFLKVYERLESVYQTQTV
uniref:Phosphatase tensin-type domain-containing protein n=1 Tax=Heterorhabditis bacteriophora TaxID=37862 RepID=A0A1I7W6J0_HETBA